MQSIFEKVKERVSIREVVEAFGVQLNACFKIKCLTTTEEVQEAHFWYRF